jgi:hypothetical protein
MQQEVKSSPEPVQFFLRVLNHKLDYTKNRNMLNRYMVNIFILNVYVCVSMCMLVHGIYTKNQTIVFF